MPRPRSEIKVVCQNEKCQYHRKEKGKNIIKRGKYPTGHQRYYCHHCDTFFMETKGTPLYRKRLTEKEIINICKHLVEKNGIRSIERITGHHRDTIGRLLEDLGKQATLVNKILIQNLHWGPIELDEMWTFLKKKKRKLSATATVAIRQATRGFTAA